MTYQIINEIFTQQKLDISPSEAHGIASAMLCVDNRTDVNNWLAQLFDDATDLSEPHKKTLETLFEQTRTLLNPEKSEFEFDLFFPDTDDLEELTIALSDWCHGFLWGIGYANSSASWSGETDSILKDMVEITKLETTVDGENEEDQEAFMQLHHYLRVAVLIIRDELTQSNTSQISH